MSVTHDKVITLINGEAGTIQPYRRVKYDGSTAAQVIYADASDGDSWIGVTLPGDGGPPAAGAPVAVALRHEGATFKMECSAAVTANASIYPEDDGKVSDDAGTVVIGTAAGESTGSASGSIVAVHPNAGSGSAPDEEAIANADGTTGAGIMINLIKTGVTASGDTEITKPSRKLKIIGAHGVLRDGTTNTNVKLVQDSTDISAAKAFTTTDERFDFDVNDALTEVAAASTLYMNLATTATAPGMDVYVQCVPVS